MSEATVPVRVWDGWVRLFHWGIVTCVAVSWFSAEWEMWDIHLLSGYVALGLLLFRLLWGLAGSANARFARFLASPVAAIRDLARFGRREADEGTTHTAAGGWMVMLLLALLLTQTISGLFANHDVGFSYSQHGPLALAVSDDLSDRMTGLHLALFNILLAAIAIHVLAVLLYRLVKGQNLVLPMITGWKRLPPGTAAPRHAPLVLGLALAALAAGVVWYVVTRLG